MQDHDHRGRRAPAASHSRRELGNSFIDSGLFFSFFFSVDDDFYQTIIFIIYTQVAQTAANSFRRLCSKHGIAVTQQRLVRMR